MTNRVLVIFLVTIAMSTTQANAQFSSTMPGVPRASVPMHGGTQTRTELDLSAIQGKGTDGDTMTFAMRLGFGRSYRVGSNVEIGFDFTLAEGLYSKLPTPDSNPDAAGTYARGLALYGLRIGGKFRPFSQLSPEGYGIDLAVGASFSPSLKGVFGVERMNDSTATGGLLGGKEEDTAVPNPLFNATHSWLQVAAMASYRSQRIMADAALVSETAKETSAAERSPLVVFDGISPRVGAMFRLTPSIALGGSYWGNGAPPWRDHVALGPHVEKISRVGATISLGSKPEAGTDIMFSSPTGKITESVRVHFRWRGAK